MPILLPTLLNFQGSSHLFGVGSFSNLIDNDIWMHMLEDRNELAHDYDGTLAEERAEKIVNQYIPIFEEFREKARGYIEELQSKG